MFGDLHQRATNYGEDWPDQLSSSYSYMLLQYMFQSAVIVLEEDLSSLSLSLSLSPSLSLSLSLSPLSLPPFLSSFLPPSLLLTLSLPLSLTLSPSSSLSLFFFSLSLSPSLPLSL